MSNLTKVLKEISIHIWLQIFFGYFWPTYLPYTFLYYINLFSKISCSLTYIPTQKFDIICECLLSKAQSVFKYVPLVACLYIDANLPVLLLYIKYCVAISIAVANLHKILLLKILVAKSVKYEIQIHMNSSNGFEIFRVSVLQIIFHTILSMLLSFLKVKMILDQMLCTS